MVAAVPSLHRRVARSVTDVGKNGGKEMNATIIGVDLAKRVIQLHGAEKSGETVYRKKTDQRAVLSVHD